MGAVRSLLVAALLLAAATARAQQPAPAPPLDSPDEMDKLKESCGAFQVVGCAEELFTGQPLHLAVGSIAPQNGFSGGVAYVGHKTTANWRINWDADGVASTEGWRAGFYLKLVDSAQTPIGIHFGTQGQPVKPNLTELPEHPVISAYAQTISLDKIGYFGLGPTSDANELFFGMRETILGLGAVKPLTSAWHASLYGEANGRFVSVQAPAASPDLAATSSFLQLGEGIRLRPVLANDVVRLNYDFAFREYLAPGDSTLSFDRLTIDLSHEFALYSRTTRDLLPLDANGPDECAIGVDPTHPDQCQAITRDREGRIGVRLFLSESFTPAGHAVPFYFQPTLGGADINGNTALGSYQDYRFRAPNVMFVRESLEHSLYGPLGATVFADEGKVALTRGGLSDEGWLHSVSVGLTLRAGGLPVMAFLYSRGGTEGTHASFLVNTSLLGGSARPSSF
jgi:hypothetical protein